jgi:signal transduction histidine kinase
VNLRSVRFRLSAVVAVTAALVVLGAATLGADAVQDRLVDDVLDDAANDTFFIADALGADAVGGLIEVEGFVEAVEAVESVEVEGSVGVEIVDVPESAPSGLDPSGLAGSATGVTELDGLALEALALSPAGQLESIVVELDTIGALDLLLDEMGRTRADGLPVLTTAGTFVTATVDGDQVTIVETPPTDTAAVVAAWEPNLADLAFTGIGIGAVEPLGSPAFDVEALDELIDEAEQRRVADLRLATGVRPLGAVEVAVVADVADVVRSVDAVRSLLWILGPLVVIVAAVAAWSLTGRALTPVRRLTDQVDEIGSRNLHERVPVAATGDEVEHLARTMNGMLERLEAGDARRRQFVSDASHELRSPVAVLRSEAELALAAPTTVDTARFAAGVAVESERLQAIIDDLLVLARHDEGGVASGEGLDTVDVDDVVLAQAGRRRAVTVTTTGVSAARIRGGEEVITRIVAHLLDNAARHADERVEVSLGVVGGQVELCVDDDGPGIPVDARTAVFERFVRLEEARSRDAGGAGLGLAVVAESVASLGGTVAVEDSPLGGARFVVRLPAAT